jgi:hypothetical protein
MSAMVIKVSSDGDIFLDGRMVSPDEMAGALAELKTQDGAVTYYRESPRSEPTEAANQVFRQVLDARVKVRLGHQAPSEWGTLDWVEVEEAPHRSRFFMARGQQFLIAFPGPGDEGPATYVGGPMSDENEERWLGQVDLLVRSDRVIETARHEPQLAFEPEELERASLHLRIGYGSDPRWSSRYPEGEVPSNIGAFVGDLHRVGEHLVASTDKAGWRQLGAEEARGLFSG